MLVQMDAQQCLSHTVLVVECSLLSDEQVGVGVSPREGKPGPGKQSLSQSSEL